MLIHLGQIECAKLLDDKLELCKHIEENKIFRDEILWLLVQGVSIQQRLLYEKKESEMFDVLKHARFLNPNYKSKFINIKEAKSVNKLFGIL